MSSEHNLANSHLRAQYERAGFAGRVGWGTKPAILVIDIAKAWTDAAQQIGSDLSNVTREITLLLEVARRKHVEVFFTTMAYDAELREIGAVHLLKTPHLGRMIRGSAVVELEPALGRLPSEPLIEKPRASAFHGTNLLSMLIAGRIDTTVVVGCSTSGCIRATCEDAFDHGFHVIVPAEAVGDRSKSAHESNLFDIDARYGDVVSIDNVLHHLETLPT